MGFLGGSADRRIGLAYDQNRRRGYVLRPQFADELHTGHGRNALLDHQAIRLIQPGIKEISGVTIDANRESFQFQREFQRAADGSILVDDYHNR